MQMAEGLGGHAATLGDVGVPDAALYYFLVEGMEGTVGVGVRPLHLRGREGKTGEFQHGLVRGRQPREHHGRAGDALRCPDGVGLPDQAPGAVGAREQYSLRRDEGAHVSFDTDAALGQRRTTFHRYAPPKSRKRESCTERIGFAVPRLPTRREKQLIRIGCGTM